ncbi:hypothetical protein AABB24_015914 [Solanum stoloniferum]|uniref:Bifunctional inhibitor/plant lipid transfer protein/seed storage helical domain-containing protein n=2 Tax=Solanum TaxID=4107 RepID=A0AAF0UJ50_SOLVR|nr:uncharacterized protein LOC125819011 [Solanum verrucosum]XP_049408413.1 uncharacterized protein LOC125871787 [Solanum stenotomum]XP_049408414.1 uncharacterized protein LOC125871787 [Solanum stenotomum]WMV47152.1 hypothetical protein MTR67_040537 [Solanum verrucosum]
MDIHNIPKIVLIVALYLVVYPSGARSQWVTNQPSPLCPSQFALVNHACSLLPLNPVSPPSPPSPFLLVAPPPPPGPPERRHRRRHDHHHEYKESSAEENCCRWMKQVDSECVCDLLVRLPLFLSRPLHQYTIMVDPGCNITFECGSRGVDNHMLPPHP